MLHKLYVFLPFAASIALAACEGSQTQSRSPGRQGGTSTTADLHIQIPGPEAFPMTRGNASDYLSSYLLRVTTDSKACTQAQIYEIKDYTGADTVTLTVQTKCSFKIRFAIGKEDKATGLQNGNLSLDTFYTTEEPIEVQASDFKKGDVTVRLHLKRTALAEKVGFTNQWVKDDLSDAEQSEIDDKDDQNDQNQDNNDNQTVPPLVSYADLKGVIDQSCAGCHRPGGARSQSDLSTYEGFKRYGSNAVARIAAGSMPPRPQSALAADIVKKFTEWQKSGFPERSTTGNPGGSTNSGDQRVIEFRIKSGTGRGAWNTESAPVTLKVGQVLRIINDDTIRHRLHTDGAPCLHGNDIPPGGSEDCVITRPFTTGSLYDHNNLGRFYIKADR